MHLLDPYLGPVFCHGVVEAMKNNKLDLCRVVVLTITN